MSNLRVVLLTLFVWLVCVPFVCSVDPPVTAPTPPPESGAGVASPPSNASSPSASSSLPSPSPSPSQSLNSPPAPPPSDSAPGTAPTPSPDNAPAPAPGDVGDVSHAADSDNLEADEHSSSMSAGKKVGIAFGVILGICAVGLGALVYKKRQQNIRRSEFGYGARDVL